MAEHWLSIGWGMQGAWNEFESATTWFNVLPQKNEFTNRVKPVTGGGGGGGTSRTLFKDNSRTKCAGVFTPQV